MNVATAIDRTRAGDAAWAAAQRAHQMAPPDDGFAERLRGTASAASLEAAALEYAITAGLTAKEPWPDAPLFAREISAGANRPGDAALWEKWDEAVKDWQDVVQGTSISDLARSFRLIAAYAEALADSVDQERGLVLLDNEDQRQIR
jgi:hypothetical protein